MKIKVAKAKAKNKAKAKVAAKCSGKIAKKIAKACIAVALMTACGCQLTPSRSQTLTMRDCTVNIYGCGSSTNELATIEIATQAMSIENSGTETLTPSQTTDVKPDIDVSVGAAKGGGILETVASRLVGGSTTATSSASSVKAAADCADGSCTSGAATCTDGRCYAN